MLKHRLHAVMVTVLLSASLGACGGGGGDDNGGNNGGTNPSIDIQADAFKLTPATFDGVLPGESIEGSTKVSGFDGSLNATFTTTGPITATLRNGKTGKATESADFKAGDTLFAKVTVNADAAAGDAFSLKLTVGSGETAVSASLKGIVGDGTAPTVSIDFPSKTSISTSHKTSITGRVADNVGIESVRIKELPGELVQLDDDGSWIFPDIPLAQGDNALTVEATDVNGLVAEETLNVFRDTLWFEDPVAIHALSDTEVLVLDNATDTLYRINLETGAQHIITSPETIGSEEVPMRHPVDMTVDAANGTVYVANAGPQINGVIKVDLATGERTVLSSTIADPPAHFIEGGSGDNWTGLVTAVSFYVGTVFTAADEDFYAVFSDGRRDKRGTVSAPIIDIEAGAYPFGATGSISGVLALVNDKVILQAVSDGHFLAELSTVGGRWLSRTQDNVVVVLEEPTVNDFDVNGVLFFENSDVLTKFNGTLNPEPADLLQHSTGAVLLADGNYLVVRGNHGHPLYGKTMSGNTVAPLTPLDYPDLSSEFIWEDYETVAHDPVEDKLYFAKSSGEDFELVQFDPVTGKNDLLLHKLHPDGVNLSVDDKAIAAHAGKVYLANSVGQDTEETKDGIYVVDVASCGGGVGEAGCVKPFALDDETRINDGTELFYGEPDMLEVSGETLVVIVYGRGVPQDDESTGDGRRILRFSLASGELLSESAEAGYLEDREQIVQGDHIFGKVDGEKTIAAIPVTAVKPWESLELISQCAAIIVGSLECPAESFPDRRGSGPAIFGVQHLLPAGDGKLLAMMSVKVPSPFNASMERTLTGGKYLIDIATGDRTFLYGAHPFDGNQIGGANIGDPQFVNAVITDTLKDVIYNSKNPGIGIEMITYREAIDPLTGETYYPVNRVLIAR